MISDAMPATGGVAAAQNAPVDGAGASATGVGGGVVEGAAAGAKVVDHQLLLWEKLSPEEFQQLQDYAACKKKSS